MNSQKQENSSVLVEQMVIKKSCKRLLTVINATLELEDVLYEIFLRLPLKSVYKFKCLSKVWFSHLSEPSFIHMVFDRQTKCSLPWTIVRCSFSFVDGGYVLGQQFQTASLKPHYNFINSHDGFPFKFLRDQVDPNLLYPSASSNGLVLCEPFTIENNKFYICNPLTKQWVLLPPPELLSYRRSMRRCLFSSTTVNSTISTIKVVLIPSDLQSQTKFNLQVFSSDTGKWITHQVLCPQGVSFCTNIDPVLRNGYLYWINAPRGDKFIAYSLDMNKKNSGTDQCIVTNLPGDGGNNHSHGFLRESEGFVVYANINHSLEKEGTLSAWVLKEDYPYGAGVWQSVHRNYELKNLFSQEEIKDFITYSFSPVNLNVLIVKGYNETACYNILTGSREYFCHSPACSSTKSHISRKEILVTPRPTIIPSLPTP